ncbi:hypothetical protein HAX54_006769 [Datura stramonium]|uniref:Uncharacterized protein n=1 Tax=Datura stramonium TaxID=4076 RepID=A0ABS8TD55_DATST|nr:hypothetical protein [Datura stramonium]
MSHKRVEVDKKEEGTNISTSETLEAFHDMRIWRKCELLENSELGIQEVTGTGETPLPTGIHRSSAGRVKSGCKASSHYPDSCFTCASRVKTSETPVWRHMNDFFTQFSVKHWQFNDDSRVPTCILPVSRCHDLNRGPDRRHGQRTPRDPKSTQGISIHITH